MSAIVRGKVHVINNETGFCETCQKFEKDPEKKYKRYGDLVSPNDFYINSVGKSLSLPAIEDGKKEGALSEFTNGVDESNKRIRYRRYKFCDCCQGKLAERFRTCRIFESLYYVPFWCLVLSTLLYFGLLASIGYLAYYHFTSIQYQTYTGECNSTLLCNSEKGLYCRALNGSSQDYCNCPARSTANTCDCPTGYFWNGLQCSTVYTIGSGPCIGDYSCTKGLTCNYLSGLCSCPDATPSWDDSSKSCTYAYKGCFISCFNSSSCDFYTSDVVFYSTISGLYQLEVDDCVNICQVDGYKYAHLNLLNGMIRCACSDSYNTFSVQAPDTDCNSACSVYKVVMNKCPKNVRHSSFQIGS